MRVKITHIKAGLKKISPFEVLPADHLKWISKWEPGKRGGNAWAI